MRRLGEQAEVVLPDYRGPITVTTGYSIADRLNSAERVRVTYLCIFLLRDLKYII